MPDDTTRTNIKCPRCDHRMARVARTNLLKCQKCEKVIYRDMERKTPKKLFRI